MKNLASITTIFAIILASFASNSFASDSNSDNHIVTISIPEVALLDLENSESIVLQPSAPAEAGDPLDFSSASNSDAWINYTSVVASGKSRKVSVKLESNNVPEGLALKVKATADAGKGEGNMGTPEASAISLTANGNGQTLITGIGSCYTGDNSTSGHNLGYTLEVNENSYGDLVQGDTDITVIYTLTEDQ